MTIATVARNKHPLLHLAPDAPSWDGAACTHYSPELWFRDDQTNTRAETDTALAKLICHEDCPIRKQCLDWALAHNETWGVWGGLTTDERGARNGQCRTCTELIPARSKARYCDGCRAKARARQNRSRAKKAAQKEGT